MVPYVSFEEGVTENVLLELDPVGDDDICIHELKLSEETWKVPEQEVSDEFVVTVEEFISLENVTEIEESMDTDWTSSLGDIELTTVWKLPATLSSSLE